MSVMLTKSLPDDIEGSARERILASAYELFSTRGFKSVGVDEVIAHSGVAKATLYSHFQSKQELAIQFLRKREERWTLDWLRTEIERRGETPEEKLVAIFDVFDEWFRRTDFEGCTFVNGLVELRAGHPIGQACVSHLENIRSIVSDLAAQADISDPAWFAESWHILMKGSIVAAGEGDAEAAQKAKAMARLLLDQRLAEVA